jgi:hypothetical protein
MSKAQLITRLTLLDTQLYRCRGIVKKKKYDKEPTLYRATLKGIYNKLSTQDIQTLIILKTYRDE